MAPLVTEYESVEGALERLRAKTSFRRTSESVRVVDSYGRVPSADIRATTDVPAFPVSHMDGFAVHASDLKGATRSSPVLLKVAGARRPGERTARPLRQGETIQVATGGGVPPGADAVVPAESVRPAARAIRVDFAPDPGSFIYQAGEDLKKGERIISQGQAIRAQDVGMLIALGFPRVRVWKKPRVSVIATGSELKPPGDPEPGKIPESHSPVFVRLCEAAGCTTAGVEIAGDEPKKLTGALRRALARSDVVITLGGTSAGRRDLVVDAVSSLRPDFLVHGIRINRGRVTAVASVKGRPILMLPGPIQGAMNAFLLLGLPLLQVLSGREKTTFQVPCTLGARWEGRKRFSDFKKVVYVSLKEDLVAEPLHGETESIRVLARADGYFVVPEETKVLERGTRVTVSLLPGFSSA